MIKSLSFIVLMAVVCNGNHPTPILDALIFGASKLRERIKNTGSFIDNFTQNRHSSGSLNIGGNFEINKGQEHFMHPPPPGPNGYGPAPNGYGPAPNGYGPAPNGYGPAPNGYGPGPNSYGPAPNGNIPGPNCYGPRPNSYEPGPNGYGPGPNGHDNNQPNYGQNQHYNNENNKKPGYYDHDYNKKDEPIHVPLNPNEVYGGDKNENNSPKRETKNDEADDDEYNIDVRFKDAK